MLPNSSNFSNTSPMLVRIRRSSRANTAPTSSRQTADTSRWNPGRSTRPDPDRPGSSSTTSTRLQPRERARSASSYCRRRLSRSSWTWPSVDWRI